MILLCIVVLYLHILSLLLLSDKKTQNVYSIKLILLFLYFIALGLSKLNQWNQTCNEVAPSTNPEQHCQVKTLK